MRSIPGTLPVVLALPLLLALPAVSVAVEPDATPLPLGELSLRQDAAVAPEDCRVGDLCLRYEVACPAMGNDLPGTLGIAPAAGPQRGVLVVFSGGDGTKWWHRQGVHGEAFLRDMHLAGITTVQVKWDAPGWKSMEPGDAPGAARLACRSATVVKWAHDHLHAPATVEPAGEGACGFCVMGFSNGGSQASFPLTHYGLAPLVDALIPTGGPVHTDFVAGCLHEPGLEPLHRDERNRQAVDNLYGYGFSTRGPCYHQDESWRDRWHGDSLVGGDLASLAGTRVHFVMGTDDNTIGPAEGRGFFRALRDAGHPDLAWTLVPGTPHSATQTDAGYDALRDAVLAGR